MPRGNRRRGCPVHHLASGARLDDGVRLPDGSLLHPGDRFEAIGAVTPIEPLVADEGGYWASVIGFCAPESSEAFVLDEVRAGS